MTDDIEERLPLSYRLRCCGFSVESLSRCIRRCRFYAVSNWAKQRLRIIAECDDGQLRIFCFQFDQDDPNSWRLRGVSRPRACLQEFSKFQRSGWAAA